MEIIKEIGFLDLAFITVFAISLIIGIIRGVVREIMSLVGLVASITLAFKFAPWLSNEFVSKAFTDYPTLSYALSFAIILFTSILCFALVSLLISQLLKFSGLSVLDRFLGSLFGLLRGTIIGMIFVFIASFFPPLTNSSWWQQSRIAPTLLYMTSKVESHVPESVKDYLKGLLTENRAKAQAASAPTNQPQIIRSIDDYNKLIQQQSAITPKTEEELQEMVKAQTGQTIDPQLAKQLLQLMNDNQATIQLESNTEETPNIIQPYVEESQQQN